MKPCPDKKNVITWLALDSLDAPSARELRTHLEICPGCRHYLAEMVRLAGQITAAAPADHADHLPPSEMFHHQVMLRIKAEAATPVWKAILASLRPSSFSWRVALPGAAILAALLMVEIEFRPHSATGVLPPSPVASQPATVATVDLAPTIAHYRQVASQSLEKLDDLLAREGEQTGPPAQTCTASSMSLRF